ncbi:MAG TPA: glycoside hydrolase 100 family protein [Burkholderiales bacterium]|nr:glycoside hydrolase 100 family protein [Burkholderiales bacterium]
MNVAATPTTDDALVQECATRSVELLKRNLSPHGILAATPNERSDARGYSAIFGRDAAICALGMATSGDAELERESVTGLLTLARHQAHNGQIAKFVDPRKNEADFWYLGCIDATLWWLIAIEFLDRQGVHPGLQTELRTQIDAALLWLSCQEHQRFGLLQQNEASDWADIMPRSGFVLYTNALWYYVKQLHGLPDADVTRYNFNHLFFPFSRDLADYRRARLLAHYVRNKARNRELYLSFVNFSFWGEEGDVFGNVLAILCGLADGAQVRRIFRALKRAAVSDMYPIRVVCKPITRASMLWRPYMGRHRQNLVWQYHNGGIWPFVGGFWVSALAASGDDKLARTELAKVARANELAGWQFNEWLHGRTLAPSGMPGQSSNAAAFLIALRSLDRRIFESGGTHSAPANPSPP